ncbi:prolyl oligopeptidase family serine peptidase [Aquabacter sp. L1I39]|uniref:alpha/beta hydrolase n=1 Tax=Aquabacter sp. L1I39 TaxID=2820278 RepID=UPI001ADC90AE|nr:prolyl oligopeptidase family serine peptidase [Aquabacter sp. L1I39]QTL02860.1 prolyl oligopeptidase family serine peptidase [Aquabacter sp. L1I39]
MPLIDGPRLPPRSGGAPDALVVLLHGYGADGRDLIDLGAAWGDLLPGAAFVSPHAPEPCGQAPIGRQWFALTDLDPRELALGARAAAPGLAGFIAAERRRLGLPASRVALMGFSQGCMMALQVALTGEERFAAVLGYSGAFVAAGSQLISEPPPILLIHGTDDDVVPAPLMMASANALAAAGVPVEWHLCPGLGHGIDEDGLGMGGAFLADHLGSARASQD